MRTVDTFTFLLGSWRLERLLEDHRSGACGAFHGNASLVEIQAAGDSEMPRRARYDEAGRLRFGTHHGPASRTLEYVGLDDGSVLLHFADGRPFIDLDLRTGNCHRIHQCDQDRYQVATLIVSPVLVEERWRVSGPTKDYSAVTTLTRAD